MRMSRPAALGLPASSRKQEKSSNWPPTGRIRSVPEAMAAYQECVAQRMQLAAEDGRRLFEESQKITHKIARTASNGWPTAGS